MTAIAARIQIEVIEDLSSRRRVTRRIAIGSASFTVLVAAIAGTLAAFA